MESNPNEETIENFSKLTYRQRFAITEYGYLLSPENAEVVGEMLGNFQEKDVLPFCQANGKKVSEWQEIIPNSQALAKKEYESKDIEWGPWFLWILTSVTAGGLAITNIFLSAWGGPGGRFRTPYGSSLGGVIGGIIVGFMPWLAQKYRFSKVGWWAGTLVSTTLTVMAVSITFTDPTFDFDNYIIYWVIPPLIASLILASVIRGICQRWLKSQTAWWEWVLTGLLVAIVLFVLFLVCFLTSMQ